MVGWCWEGRVCGMGAKSWALILGWLFKNCNSSFTVLTSFTGQAIGVRGEEQEEGGEGDGGLPGAAKSSSKELNKQHLTNFKQNIREAIHPHNKHTTAKLRHKLQLKLIEMTMSRLKSLLQMYFGFHAPTQLHVGLPCIAIHIALEHRPLSVPFLFCTSGKGTDMATPWGWKNMGKSIFNWEDGPPWGKMHPNWWRHVPGSHLHLSELFSVH